TLPGRLARSLSGQCVEQLVHRRFLGSSLHLVAAAVALEPNGLFDEVARDLLDVTADIADLRELGRFNLDERGIGELCKPPADLGLAAPRWTDHQNILGSHLLAQLGRELLTPPAVAKRHGN